MSFDESVRALRRLQVETGSLACLGCGHEHSCSTRGCAIIRKAADRMEAVQQENKVLRKEADKRLKQVVHLATENAALLADLKSCLIDNCQFCAHHEAEPDCECDCLTCESEGCACRTCRDGSRFEWTGPREEK